MITRMEHGIGRIVEIPRQNGRFENTLFLFLSDNDGCEEDVKMPFIKRFAKDPKVHGSRDVRPMETGPPSQSSVGALLSRGGSHRSTRPAESRPEKVKQRKAEWQIWAERADVVPGPFTK